METPGQQKGYPITSKQWETWFSTGFVVQWGEWDRTLEIFSHIDKLFKWYEPYVSYVGIKRKLFGPENKQNEQQTPQTTSKTSTTGLTVTLF